MAPASSVRSRALAVAASTAIGLTLAALPLRSADLRPDYQPPAYAIKGARVVADEKTTYDPGTVVIRRGVIEAVGPADKVEIPYDAETVEGKGLTVYPGFLDLATSQGTAAGATRSLTGPGRTVNYADFALPSTPPDNRNGITPEFQVASSLELADQAAEERRGQGFSDILSMPAGSIATGQSALVSTGGLPRRESVVKSPVALHINVSPPRDPAPPAAQDATPGPRRRQGGGGVERRYPTALMGAVAHLRQAMLDAEYDHTLHAAYESSAAPVPPFDPSLQALYAARTKTLPVWWEAETRDEIHRALDLAEEFGTTCVIVGGRESGKVADRLKALDVPVVFRLGFPEEPKKVTEAEYRKRDAADREEPLKVIEDRAAKWKEWVEAAKTLEKSGVRFAFGTEGMPKGQTAHAQVRKLIAAGLSKEAAVDALSRRAAEIAGLSQRLGTITPGKLGHVVAWTGPYGDERSRPRYAFLDGQKFDLEKTGAAAKKKGRRPEGKSDFGNAKEADDDTPEKEKEKAKDESKEAAAEKEKAEAEPAKAKDAPDAKKAEPTPREQEKAQAQPKTPEDQPQEPKPFVDVATELEDERKPTVHTGGNAFIKDATILTVSKAKGTIPKGSILIKDGKIAAVGEGLTAPEGVTVIDGAGLVAMPGIIDTHSHMAIQGGVNEGSLSIVPEVRVKDVVTGNDPTIYRALAGGTTSARLLHGSANTIGGQDAVIKLRHGQAGRDLLVKNAPQGVKFALGENVTRSAGRFPNTRMGVEATIERAFLEGRAYRESWKAYEAAKAKGQSPAPPRKDLRLEALAGILDGSIRIHSHCYRSDEILMLLGVAERYGVRVRSLQHVLEGYKVAPEIAAHGASASTFSDWWAYKIEAYDAIPYNAALLTQAGASVCIKSDSEELVRHLNLEAAKMVKYGAVKEEDALAMITLNPAKELGLDDRLGSIEVGKDADVALFNGHPFNGFARCEFALIDGEVWFQRDRSGGKAKRPSVPAALALGEAGRDRPLAVAANPKNAYALVGATVHPVSGPAIPNGTVVIADGKISVVGGPETAVPPSVQTVDLRGYDLWPGMIDAGSTVGLFEIGSLRETQDFADSAQYQPELSSSKAIHPDSEVIPVTRVNGVLASYTQPSGGTISGQGCVIGLDGWVPREMVINDRVALNVNVPAYVPPPEASEGRRPGGFGGQGAAAAAGEGADPRQRRKERIDELKEQFRRALAYDKVRKAAEKDHAAAPSPDPRLDALVPYALGQKPVIFQAEHRGEILDALAIAKELKLKAVISGGRDAWKVADALKQANVPVIVAGTLRLPAAATDPYDAPYANPGKLHEAGVTVAIRSKDSGTDLATGPRNLPYEAATAVAYGLPEDEALKAVTITPARILGVDDQLGSIESGKRANLVVTLGGLLQPTAEVKAIFVNGKPVSTDSKHTLLYEKYRKRLGEVRSGTAPLGIEVRKLPPASPAGPAATNGGGDGTH